MGVPNKKWERVYRWLLAYIDENKFSGNLKLPSENALCRDLKVSRDTVRAAMDQLERESLIRRVQGSGTYFNRDVAMSRELDSGRAKVKIGMILPGPGRGRRVPADPRRQKRSHRRSGGSAGVSHRQQVFQRAPLPSDRGAPAFPGLHCATG